METIIVGEVMAELEQIYPELLMPEPEPGVHVITVESARSSATRRWITVATESGGRCEIPLGDLKKQKRMWMLLLGRVPEDTKFKDLVGQRFKVRLRKEEYRGFEYWEISRA